MQDRTPPPAALVLLTDSEAVLEARPSNKSFVLALTVAGLAISLAFLGYALVFQSQGALLVALLTFCVDAFTVPLTLIALRAIYRVRFDFDAGKVTVHDRGGWSKATEWSGEFDAIGEVVPTADGLAMVWKGGEPGPALVMPGDEAIRFRARIAQSG